jgi:hypothetical protein
MNVNTTAFVAMPAHDAAAPERTPSSMFDLILRGRERLDDLLRDESQLGPAAQKLLLLALLGLLVHGTVVGLSGALLPSQAVGAFFGRGHPWAWLPLSFAGAFLGALGLCLPSFWFYTQLSGLDASLRLVAAQALRAQATTSVLLLGILPFYAAYALGAALRVYDPAGVITVGLLLPFAVGLWGVAALYRAFSSLAGHLPKTHERRGNFLLRMVLAWSAVYTAIAPIALWRIAAALGGIL